MRGAWRLAVITEHHTRKTNQKPVEDPIAVAYWPPDTHHVRRIVKDGFASPNEGFLFFGDDWAYRSASRARWKIPKASECSNLLTDQTVPQAMSPTGAELTNGPSW
jgi:hypothetical protein